MALKSITDYRRKKAAHMMAERLADHALAMGLDDKDEVILWFYIHSLWLSNPLDLADRVSSNVISALKEQGQMNALVIKDISFRASMPARFDKLRQQFPKGLRRLSFRQKRSTWDFHVTEKSHEELIAEMKEAMQRDIFTRWYPHLVSWKDPEAQKTIEPSSSDVILDIHSNWVDLRDALFIE